MKQIQLSEKRLDLVIRVLQRGGIVVFPSDTVYGLLCDATNKEAVCRLIDLKNRPWGKPISVFVNDFTMMEKIVDLHSHELLLKQLLPGPFTIVLPTKNAVVPLLESERETLGVRFPQFSLVNKLTHLFGKPITATSANISGRRPHYTVEGYLHELSEKKKKLISLVCDYGKLPRNKPSTIIDLTNSHMRLFRKGDVIPFSSWKTFITNTTSETRSTARYILQRELDKKQFIKPIIFILRGPMGVGKTIMAKGFGDVLKIYDVLSPTYTIYDEYKVSSYPPIDFFIHADFFLLETEEDLNVLHLDRYLQKNSIWCVEWGEKMGSLTTQVKEKANVILIDMEYINKTNRKITVKFKT